MTETNVETKQELQINVRRQSWTSSLKEYWSIKKTRISISMLSIVAAVTVIFLIGFIMNRDIIQRAISEYELMGVLVALLSFRIALMAFMSFFIMVSWLKSENVFLSDAKFMFGLFFLILTFGKVLDLFWNLTYFYFEPDVVLILLKIRFELIVLTLLPMYYFGLYIILFSINPDMGDIKVRKTRNIAILIIAPALITTILLAPNEDILNNILPLIVIPSLSTIVIVFYLAYKGKRLSDVNPLIIMVGFTLYLISNIARASLKNILGATVLYVLIAEIIDLVVFSIMFIGFATRIKYKHKPS